MKELNYTILTNIMDLCVCCYIAKGFHIAMDGRIGMIFDIGPQLGIRDDQQQIKEDILKLRNLKKS